jgi:hypothetical protein
MFFVIGALLFSSLYTAPKPGRAVAAQTLSWQQVPVTEPIPAPRSQFGLASDGAGNVYLYGGRGEDGSPLDDFWTFRPATGAWRQLQNTVVPALVEPHLAVDGQGNVLEFGGIGDPRRPHMSYDGHSYGIYRFSPGAPDWTDLTAADAEPGDNWPPGREDHGFTFDAHAGLFFVFGGEGTADMSLGDMWSFNEATGAWSPIAQRYQAPGGASIDARELYAISYDNHDGLYLFGGSYVTPSLRDGIIPPYVNDLWHFDVPTATWTLVAGTANGYDPSLPVPRHYYGQACDADGNLYVLGGYVSDTATPPFFASDATQSYAHQLTMPGATPSPQLFTFGLADFWTFTAGTGRWANISGQLGDLAGQALVPYVVAADQADDAFVTFGGLHQQGSNALALSNSTWVYGLPAESGAMAAIPTLAPTTTPQFTSTPETPTSDSTGKEQVSVSTMVAVIASTPTPGRAYSVGTGPPISQPGNDDNPAR